jgi:hypothetical protein
MPRFLPSQIDPRRMIARATLDTLRDVLRGSGSHRLAAAPECDRTVAVRLADHPILARIGGVVRVDPGPGGAIAIARIGGSCFVAFELGSDGLRELPVHIDPDAATLRILRPGVTPGTAARPLAS